MIRDSFGQVRRNSRSRKLNPAMKERSMKLSKVCFLAVFSSAVLFSTGELKAYGQAPSDPQIAGIVQAANQIDIDQAKLALKKTSSQQVKEFANQMISDHTNLQKSVSDLAKKLGVAPEDSATSKQLKQQADDETSKLKSLHGNAFDKEYASHEVVFHQAVIDAAKSTLIPNAKNAELKSALEGAAPLLQGHLEHAQQLEQSLSSK
jgi:putative membrane protein